MFAGREGHACDNADLQSEHGACSPAAAQRDENTRANSGEQSQCVGL